MRIIADSAIPFVQAMFDGLGSLELVEAGRLCREVIAGADVLLVRTVTRVDRNLLYGTDVRFVATASSGTDHVDRDWLASENIGFADAGGCNARAVCEYVLSSLASLSRMRRLDLASFRVGIVGAGHVGSLLGHMLSALDIFYLLNDPPLAEKTGEPIYRPLDELLDFEVLTFHVALTESGVCPTRDMLSDALLAQLRPDVCLINTSRGAICDEAALMRFLDNNPKAVAVLDVWADEPALNVELLRRACVGTAHIAGYSLDAKLRATSMIRDAVCRYFNLDPGPAAEPQLPPPAMPDVSLGAGHAELDAVQSAILAGYDVLEDDVRLRPLLETNLRERQEYFVDLRTNYPFRREFPARRVAVEGATPALQRKLSAVGFQVAGIG